MLARVTALAVCLLAGAGSVHAKRPLTHADYAGWKSIQSPTLSRDGKWLAYGLFPQEGDGELVVRELATGKEHREPAGALPPAGDADPDQADPAPRPSIRIRFTGDNGVVAASLFPPQAAVQQARREKKPAPKNGLVIVRLDESFTSTRVAAVKSFQVSTKAGGWVAFHHEPAAKAGEPSDLTLRRAAAGDETKIASVTEFALAQDGGLLAYAQSMAGDQADASGVYAITPGAAAGTAPIVLAKGKGKYSKLTWDRAESQLAFLTDKDDAAAKPARRYSVYHWWRRGGGAPAAAAPLATPATAGLPEVWIVSADGALTFARDGRSLWLGTAPAPPPTPAAAEPSGEEPVVADLWHWKDPLIQPMQKVRAERDRKRSYRAVVHLADKHFQQVATPSMPLASPSDDGLWAVGVDENPYRQLVGVDGNYADYYLVDTRTGQRSLAAERLRSGPTAGSNPLSWSPDSKRVLFYRDRDWYTMNAPASVAYNLTRGLGVAFHDERWDAPGPAPAYGQAGWTSDGRWVLLYDRYDVWQVAADGSRARRLTAGAGREKRTVFRLVRFEDEEDEDAPRGVNPAKPLVLSAVDEATRASGFWRRRLDGGETAVPEKLVMEDRRVAFVAKAKDADVVLTESTTYHEAPDLELTDSAFAARRKVTRANPQQDELAWGSAELIHYRSADGEPLRGILYKPEGFDPGKRYPLIVYIYERLSDNLHRFVEPRPTSSVSVPYYVSNGYLMLLPDISYRIGSPGQSALKCVLPAVQAVVDQGFVNEAAIGIQGHSWGGYQIAYMVTQTNRFRAVIAGAPVGNMTSAYNGIRWGTGLARQFQYEQAQSRIGGSLWTAPMKFIENSPVFMADRIATPMLMLHDDDDDAVPWQQGIEMFLSLRRNGKEAYLFNYNGEKHGLRKRPNQKDWTRRMQEYFDHFLKGAPRPEWMERGIPYLERIEEKRRYSEPPSAAPAPASSSAATGGK